MKARRESTAHTAIVILGASGDLAKRKLLPALAALYTRGELDDSSIVLGSGRSAFTDEEFRTRAEGSSEFLSRLYYHQGIIGLKNRVKSLGSFKHIIVFFAIPPHAYANTAKKLADEGLTNDTTIIIEKPFGYDFDSAKGLNQKLTEHFQEEQVYRIDHYLAKEAVQNILVFRFANALFYPVWNSRYIESIQINAFEQIGIEERAQYFDRAGIIRDMVQNHLVQLLCLIAMEPPVNLGAEEIRSQKINVLKTLRLDSICKYQYEGYTQEKGVAIDSKTETYAEMKLFIDNFRWSGMPIYIRVGKALNRKGTEIGLRFKRLPKLLFNKSDQVEPNRIIFKIQPAEGIIVDIASKIPGLDFDITNTSMNFCYRDSFSEKVSDAYLKLLLDALKCDRTLFVSAEETELSWKKLASAFTEEVPKLYSPGTVPKPCLCADWINFEKYVNVC